MKASGIRRVPCEFIALLAVVGRRTGATTRQNRAVQHWRQKPATGENKTAPAKPGPFVIVEEFAYRTGLSLPSTKVMTPVRPENKIAVALYCAVPGGELSILHLLQR
jgi:hypothetical protein